MKKIRDSEGLFIESGAGGFEPSSIFTAVSTTKGWLKPKMTTTQRDAIASPATGLEIYNTTTNENNVYNGTSWVSVGSGAGGSGSGAKNYYPDENFEDLGVPSSVTTYDDGGATYVDGAGGSPSFVAAGVASFGPLQGLQSLTLNKGTGNAQGEGFTLTTDSIDGIDRATLLFGSFAIEADDSDYQGDLELNAYEINGATKLSVSIEGFESNLIPAGFRGKIRYKVWHEGNVATAGALGIRLSFHITGTSTASWQIKLDEFRIGPQQQVTVMPYSDPQLYTPTFTGFGTVGSSNIQSWRVGKYLFIEGAFTSDTPTATEARVSLGYNGEDGGVTSASTLPTLQVVGSAGISGTSGNSGTFTMTAEASVGYLTFAFRDNSIGGLTKRDGDEIAVNGTVISFFARVQIESWGSNAVIGANRKTFRATEINWTEVSAEPTNFGEYWPLEKDASALTYSDGATPTSPPSSADGFRVDTVSGTSASTSGRPMAYMLNVGKNKSVQVVWHAGTGLDGEINTDPWVGTTGIEYGYTHHYNKRTGVLTVWHPLFVSTGADRHAGVSRPGGTGAPANIDTAYFDVIIGESPSDLFIEQAMSEVWVTNGNGRGSTDVYVRRYTNTQKNTGSAITYDDSSTAGATFTINEPGLYAISQTHNNDGIDSIGISLNASSGATALLSLTEAEVLACDFQGAANQPISNSVQLRLSPGDVIRSHTNDGGGRSDGTNTVAQSFRITKIGP